MSNLAVSNASEPPRKTNQRPSSPLLFMSLPHDIVLNVLARVPKRCYPILCCVCKKLRSLVRSPEIYKTRSLLKKDSLYICFFEKTKLSEHCHWFTIRGVENNTTETVFVSVDFPTLPWLYRYSSSVVAVDQEIFFIPASYYNPSSSFWIFDTQSEKARRGPRMLVNRLDNHVTLVGGKIYVMGGCGYDEIQAEVFDLKTQTWEAAPDPEEKRSCIRIGATTVSLDRKVCVLSLVAGMICYDTRVGSCEISDLPKDNWWLDGVCVIDNVLYIYYSRFGLMWYDSALMLWRVVYGLNLSKFPLVGMAEYNGKLAFLWKKDLGVVSKEIWCRMIVLDRSEAGIYGTAEPSQLIGIVPRGYWLHHCLSLG